ncbi:MAG TPA: NAD(P)/FAD-dependent oxidoreductase [Acidimicrobiales bacterium]|nr:NAD(P)/FAD-dependent oxidoreductase [Acidimicrobiales bacterium]
MSPFDQEAVKAKYLAERDKRLVAGRTAIRDLKSDAYFARFREDPFTPIAPRAPLADDVDVCIIGGGIAGVLAGAQLRKAGVEKIRILDQAGGIGGTWYWNRYPGVMCDVESYIYLPMLEEMGYVPTRRYASGEEIRRYLESLAQRFDLVAPALFHTGVTRAEWDDTAARWRVETDRGDNFSARYYVVATGILNLMKLPAIPGMENFGGHAFHTARWDYEYTGGGPDQPLDKLADKVVGLVGTGATGIQALPPLAAAAKHVYVFQRTPSAIGVRGNRDTEPTFVDTCTPGWQKARMDNFQAQMLGKTVDADLTDDGWTHHYAKVQNAPRWKGMTYEEYMRNAEEIDFGIMEEHRQRVDAIVRDKATAEILKPYYRYLCKRPCFHDEYLDAYNNDNVTLVDCPAGFDEVTSKGPVVNGHQYELDCIVYATGFEAELTPLPRRIGHELVGRDGVTLAEKFADGASTMFGMMTRGFPNMFIMPTPALQSVVTVNYTQLAVVGSEFVGGAVRVLDERGAKVFDVAADAEDAWTNKVMESFIDPSHVMSACTPSRLNNEGDPGSINPRNGNWGRGFGDFFGYRDLLEEWVASGECDGLEVS